jgi:hypothetical protein
MLIVGGGAFAAIGAVIAAPFNAVIGRRAREFVRARPVLGRSVSLASASYDIWAAQVGAAFAVGGGQGITLAGVRALESSGPRPPGARDRAFVALFDVRGAGTMAGDLIYTVSHSEYGPLQVFLSTADARTPGRMMAIFN